MSPNDVDDRLRTLLHTWELVDVEVLAVHADRRDESSNADEREEREAQVSLESIEHNPDTERVRFRFRATVAMAGATAAVEVAPVYDTNNVSVRGIPPDVLTEFINKVAGMNAIPYLRAEVADVSRRVFPSPVTLPIVHQSELNFEPFE